MQGFAVGDDKVNFSYLTLPVMAKFYISKGFNLEAGPYFGYLLSTSPNTTVIDGAQINIENLNGGLDVGVGIGLGFETQFGIFVGARYNIGLSDMAKNLQWKNNVATISIGWLF